MIESTGVSAERAAGTWYAISAPGSGALLLT